MYEHADVDTDDHSEERVAQIVEHEEPDGVRVDVRARSQSRRVVLHRDVEEE